MSTKSKVAIYCRLSEEDRNKQSETDDSNSIQNQKSMLLLYSLEKLVADMQKQLDVIERKIQAGDNRRQLIEQYTNLEHLDRETVKMLIDYILVGKKDPVTKEVPVKNRLLKPKCCICKIVPSAAISS